MAVSYISTLPNELGIMTCSYLPYSDRKNLIYTSKQTCQWMKTYAQRNESEIASRILEAWSAINQNDKERPKFIARLLRYPAFLATSEKNINQVLNEMRVSVTDFLEGFFGIDDLEKLFTYEHYHANLGKHPEKYEGFLKSCIYTRYIECYHDLPSLDFNIRDYLSIKSHEYLSAKKYGYRLVWDCYFENENNRTRYKKWPSLISNAAAEVIAEAARAAPQVKKLEIRELQVGHRALEILKKSGKLIDAREIEVAFSKPAEVALCALGWMLGVALLAGFIALPILHNFSSWTMKLQAYFVLTWIIMIPELAAFLTIAPYKLATDFNPKCELYHKPSLILQPPAAIDVVD